MTIRRSAAFDFHCHDIITKIINVNKQFFWLQLSRLLLSLRHILWWYAIFTTIFKVNFVIKTITLHIAHCTLYMHVSKEWMCGERGKIRNEHVEIEENHKKCNIYSTCISHANAFACSSDGNYLLFSFPNRSKTQFP